jgi:FHA domain
MSASVMSRIIGNETARKGTAYAVAAALLVVLWGGYIRKWQWTGLQDPKQLWDWLTLLLLPFVLGTIPVWIQHRKFIGKGRRDIYAVLVVAWTGFVIAGYLIPIGWTGFSGVKLWGWLGLLADPAAVATAVTLFDMAARGGKIRLGPYQKAILAALLAGWTITIIGGYALHWTWTGYITKTASGYTDEDLWDWLRLLLPLMFPIILLPPLVKWVTGNAAGRAIAAQEAAAARTATGNAAGRTRAPQEAAAARTATAGAVGVNQCVNRQGLWSVPGQGVLARQGDLILLSAIDERGLVEKLLDSLAKTSEGGGDGRRFADAVEDLVESDETWSRGHEGGPGPAVVAIGPEGDGLAVIVSGTAWAEIVTAHGTDRLVAGQPARVLRCVVGVPVHAVRGGLGTDRGVGDRTDHFSRLDRGSVRAGGLSYHSGLPAAPRDGVPQGGAAPEAVVPLAHHGAAPDGASPVSAADADADAVAVAPIPTAEEGAGVRQWPFPVVPYSRQSGAVKPQATQSERAEPETTDSGTTELVEGEPETADSGTVEPEIAGPEAADAGTTGPGTGEPVAGEPLPPPQADPARPATKVDVPDVGAAPVAAPSDAAVPARDVSDLTEVLPLPPAAASKNGTGVPADALIVVGVYCKNGHFGDPEASSCALCGASRNRRGSIPQPGPRPALGALVFDDDSALELSADCVIGRNPALDTAVAAGEALPLRFLDSQVSRIHARVHLDGWRVFLIDLGSANGTRIQPPGKRSDQALEPNVPVPLQSGTRVFVGMQGFRYEYRRGSGGSNKGSAASASGTS